MSNRLNAEEIASEARRATLAEIQAALEDARTAGAARWGWVARRLREGKRK